MGKLLYSEEHLSCYNYDNGAAPLVECITLAKGEAVNLHPIVPKIIFVIKGALKVSFAWHNEEIVQESQMILIPPGSNCYLTTDSTPANILVLRMKSFAHLCDTYSIEKLKFEAEDAMRHEAAQYSLAILTIDERLRFFFEDLVARTNDGLRCFYYCQLKIKELLFILRGYYPKEELAQFFAPILTNNISFADQVYRYMSQVKTVKGLAAVMGYSLSGFQKKFKKTFGSPPNVWLLAQRSKVILSEINTTHKSFKEISEDYGFSSPSHFNGFCRIHFGCTPAQLRKLSSSPNDSIEPGASVKKNK